LPLGKMGARLQVHPASVTNLVDGLERAGCAAREPHPTDGRMTLAAITFAGRGVAAQASKTMHAIAFGIEALDPDQLDELTDHRARRRDDSSLIVRPIASAA